MKFTVAIVVLATLASLSESRRIVGGQFAEEHQFPYQIGLFHNGNFRCGGSVIDSNWILTAAHCVLDGVSKIPPHTLEVFVGSAHLDGDSGYRVAVEDTFAHESYGNFQNDIALIKLHANLHFDKSVKPIALNTHELEESTPVVISGYGRVGNGQPISEQLKYNTMQVTSDADCAGQTGINYGGLICFNGDVNNGACNGDSGGPAVHNGRLVGVANFVINGCGSDAPDGYAKVAYYVDWIEQVKSRN